MRALRPSPESSRAFLQAYLLAVAAAVGIHVCLPAGVKELAYAVTAFIPVIGIPVGVRVNRITKPLAWYVLAVALGLAAVANTVTGVSVSWGPVPGQESLLAGLYPAAYLGVLIAACVLVARHAPRDAGKVVDAALVGVCGAGMLWEWVLRPHLAPGYATATNKITVLVSTVALMAVLGALLRVMKTIGRARTSLVLIFVSFTCIATGRVFDEIGYWDETYPLFILGNVSLAAAALHPAAAHMTAATDQEPDPVTSGRLLRMGLILAVIPLVGGVPQLFGQSPDGLLLTVGTLMTIPLVLVRVGQLGRQRQETQQALAHQAAHDELTGLPNRRTVLDELDRAVKRYNARELDGLTVLFCDLDGFKPINDGLGHQVGDEVLKVAAARLRDCLRTDDLIGRIGGDEFLIVCQHPGSDDLVSRVERVFDDPLVVSTGAVRLGVSVGLARTSPGTPTTGDALVATADEAMYEVKRARQAAAR